MKRSHLPTSEIELNDPNARKNLVLLELLMAIFKIFYWAALIAEIIARAPFQKTWKAGEKTEQRVSPTEQVLLGLLSASTIFPLIYSVTHWLDFADYHLPVWMG